MSSLKEKYRRFREWQQQPHKVAPLSDEVHTCTTCGTTYTGNFCPRCGQSAKIGRYSLKNAILLYLDVWGLGNRGMFRSIRDLILRPGYMIRDYLQGMQMAYFPPFKMFFLIFALAFMIDTGLNIRGIDRQRLAEKKVMNLSGWVGMNENPEAPEASLPDEARTAEAEGDNTPQKANFEHLIDGLGDWLSAHTAMVSLFMLLLFTLPLWLLFRHCPAIPDFRLSECFVSMVYIINMVSIYTIIPSFFCFGLKDEAVFNLLALLLIIIPIRQLTGYTYGGTIWRIVVAFIPFAIMVAILFISVALFIGLLSS